MRYQFNNNNDNEPYYETVNRFEEHVVNVTDEELLMNLTEQISEQRRSAKHWKSKYISLKLSKLRTCADIGNKLQRGSSSGAFSFSSCLAMLGSAMPELNITTFQGGLGDDLSSAKPAESLSEHVSKAWFNLKSQWKRNVNREYHNDADLLGTSSFGDDSAEVVNNNDNSHTRDSIMMIKDNVKRFRKMFSNIMASDDNNDNNNKYSHGEGKPCTKEYFDLTNERPIPCKGKYRAQQDHYCLGKNRSDEFNYNNKKYSKGDGKPCTKEYFDLTSERPIPCKGKYRASPMTPPEPSLKDLEDDKDQGKSSESQSMPYRTTQCYKDRHDEEDNLLINLVKERGPRCDRKCFKMPNVEEQLRVEKAELEKKVERLLVLFRIYKAKAQSKLAQTKRKMEERIDAHKMQRKERVKRLKQQKQELKNKIRELKEKRQAKHDKEVAVLEQKNRDLRNTIQKLEKEKRYWERIERYNMRQNLDDLEESLERTKVKYVSKIKTMRQKFSKYVSQQKHKMKDLTNQLQQQKQESANRNKDDSKLGCQSIKLINDRLQRKLDYYKSRYSYSTLQVEQLNTIVKNAEKERARFATHQREQLRRSKRAQQEQQQLDDHVSELPIIPSVYCADQKHCMKGDDGIMEKDEQSLKEEDLDMLPEEVVIVQNTKEKSSSPPTSFTYSSYFSSNKELTSSASGEEKKKKNQSTETTIQAIEVDGKKKYFKIIKFVEGEGDDELESYVVSSLDDNDDEISEANDEEEIFPPKPSPSRSSFSDFTSSPPGKPRPPGTLSQPAGKPSQPDTSTSASKQSPPAKPTPPNFLKDHSELIEQELMTKKTENGETALNHVIVGAKNKYKIDNEKQNEYISTKIREEKSADGESETSQRASVAGEEPTEFISVRITEEQTEDDENGNKRGDKIVWIPRGPAPSSLSEMSDVEIKNWLAAERPNAEKHVVKKGDLFQESSDDSNSDEEVKNDNKSSNLDVNQESVNNGYDANPEENDNKSSEEDVINIWYDRMYDEETEKEIYDNEPVMNWFSQHQTVMEREADRED